jgi:hypothetical protein
MSPSELVTCVYSFWSPQIGDPTAVGWLTVVLYALTATLAALVFVRRSGRQRIFWLGLSVLLFALAVNKQLDLQSALTAAGRCLAQAQGWYEERQSVQLVFIFSVAITCLLIAIVLAWALRQDFGHIWLALIGVALLLAFVAIRAAGFHHFDRFIGYEFANIRMNWVMELGGIALIALNALLLLMRGAGRRST